MSLFTGFAAIAPMIPFWVVVCVWITQCSEIIIAPSIGAISPLPPPKAVAAKAICTRPHGYSGSIIRQIRCANQRLRRGSFCCHRMYRRRFTFLSNIIIYPPLPRNRIFEVTHSRVFVAAPLREICSDHCFCHRWANCISAPCYLL